MESARGNGRIAVPPDQQSWPEKWRILPTGKPGDACNHHSGDCRQNENRYSCRLSGRQLYRRSDHKYVAASAGWGHSANVVDRLHYAADIALEPAAPADAAGTVASPGARWRNVRRS